MHRRDEENPTGSLLPPLHDLSCSRYKLFHPRLMRSIVRRRLDVSTSRCLCLSGTIFPIDSWCGSPLWPTKDWSMQHFNLSRCHQLQTRGRWGVLGWRWGRDRGSVDRSRAMTPDCHCRCARWCEGSAHTHTVHAPAQKTHIKAASQSLSQCPLEGLDLCPPLPPHFFPPLSPQTSQHSSVRSSRLSFSLIVTDEDAVHALWLNVSNFMW